MGEKVFERFPRFDLGAEIKPCKLCAIQIGAGCPGKRRGDPTTAPVRIIIPLYLLPAARRPTSDQLMHVRAQRAVFEQGEFGIQTISRKSFKDFCEHTSQLPTPQV
jgi:hypothetical protein